MRFIPVLIVITMLVMPFPALACGVNQEPQLRQHIRFYPIVGDKTSHWPAEVKAAIGSVASFMIPVGAKIELRQRQNDPYSPLTLLDEAGARTVHTSRYLVPAWVDVEHDTKKFKWVHLVASGYGTSEVRMRSPNGWFKSVKFALVYPSETAQAVRPPVQLTLGAGGEKVVQVDAYDNFEVTTAGNVSDGWTASPASETGFNLIRIQQVEKIYSGPSDSRESEPQVKLFFASTRNPKSTTMTLRQGGMLSGRTIKFKIEAMPTPMC